jgi:hypothetical protein
VGGCGWRWWDEKEHLLLLFICLIIFQSFLVRNLLCIAECLAAVLCCQFDCKCVSSAMNIVSQWNNRKHRNYDGAESDANSWWWWVTYHDPPLPTRTHPSHRQQSDHPSCSMPAVSSEWISEPKIDDWFELFGNDWGWYGDFYNLFKIFARLMFPEHSSHLFTLRFFSIKSSGIYWMMMIHYIFRSSPPHVSRWHEQLKKKSTQKKREKIEHWS